MSQTPNLDAARASLQQAIDQANAIVKPIIDAMREAGMLTPAPEPAAAPAVDDELLLAIAREVYGDALEDETAHMRALLASETMQRLRAVWTAEAARSGDAVERAQYDHVLSECKTAERERDEARDELSYALGEVERLRAAVPSLPDVGPVENLGDDLRVDGVLYDIDTSPDLYRRVAARLLAVAAFLDAEAADTSSDDEGVSHRQAALNLVDSPEHTAVRAELHVVRKACADDYLDYDYLAGAAIRALDAHRARGGQEAGQ